jgi:hypothetical protein
MNPASPIAYRSYGSIPIEARLLFQCYYNFVAKWSRNIEAHRREADKRKKLNPELEGPEEQFNIDRNELRRLFKDFVKVADPARDVTKGLYGLPLRQRTVKKIGSTHYDNSKHEATEVDKTETSHSEIDNLTIDSAAIGVVKPNSDLTLFLSSDEEIDDEENDENSEGYIEVWHGEAADIQRSSGIEHDPDDS